MIYFDNAATSFPKPETVYQAMENFMKNIGGNPGRSGHRLSIEAARIIYETRESLAKLFNVKDSSRIVFTSNATEALNLGIKGLPRSCTQGRGLLNPSDEVITSAFEHNSVMRPLRTLEKEIKIKIEAIPPGDSEIIDLKKLESRITKRTKLIICIHASNVTGDLMPIEKIGKIARKHNVIFMVDAAQTAGTYPINLQELNIDLLAFTGHKALFGPQGTGGLYISEGIELKPLKQGGTGSNSEFEEQPDFLPDKYESGTPNTVGIAGLGAGVKFILQEGVDKIKLRKRNLTEYLLAKLNTIKGIRIYGHLIGDLSPLRRPADEAWPKRHGTNNPDKRTSIVSFNIRNLPPSEVSQILSEKYEIMTRPGLHCSPAAHKTLGTFPDGTVRISLSYLNTEAEIDYLIDALKKIPLNC